MTELAEQLKSPLAELLLSIADDKLMLGHRNAEWTGLGPILEEDIAFSSLAQDDIAHALALYQVVAGLKGGTADAIAMGRAAGEYRCCELVELPDGFDWSVAIARQFLCDHFDQIRIGRLAGSAYEPLRQLATRILAEERLAIGHADQWIVRLGKAGGEARAKVQSALRTLAPHAGSLFEPTAGVEQLEEAGVYPRGADDPFETWSAAIENVLAAATLEGDFKRHAGVGGRRGQHSPHFAGLLEEMTEVYRLEPEGSW